MSLYVGKVVTYMIHRHGGQTHFLAVIETAKKTTLDHFNVPTTVLFSEYEHKKLMVCDVTHIITIASLVRYDTNESHFKWIRPAAEYFQFSEGRRYGELRYM